MISLSKGVHYCKKGAVVAQWSFNTHVLLVNGLIPQTSIWSNTYLLNIIRVDVGGTIRNPGGCSDPDSYMILTTLSEEAKECIYSTSLAESLDGQAYLVGDVCTYGEGGVLAMFLKGVSCHVRRYSASSKRSDYRHTSLGW